MVAKSQFNPVSTGETGVKNITLSVPDEIYRRARIKAAERDTSVSAVVAAYLKTFAAGDTDSESQKRRMLLAREKLGHYEVGRRVQRDELHER